MLPITVTPVLQLSRNGKLENTQCNAKADLDG